jgi:streptomycin 6-kinase
MAVDQDAALLDYANKYCNREYTVETAPDGVLLFIERAKAFYANAAGLEQRRLGDASWTYSTEFPPSILALLKPYRLVKFV